MNVHGVELIERRDMVCVAHRRENGFEAESVQEWIRAIKPTWSAIDIGSYSGLYAILAAQRGAVADAWEPNPTLAKRIRQNVTANKVEVEVVQAAAGSSPGLRTLVMKFPTTSAGHLVQPGDPLPQGTDTLLVNVAVPAPVIRCCAIKIDVEGWELEVLEGLQPILDRDHPLVIAEALNDQAATDLQLFFNGRGYLPGSWADNRNMIFKPKKDT